MTIQRYEMYGQYDQWDMEPDAEGKYVLFADHEAAVAAARAEAWNDALEEAARLCDNPFNDGLGDMLRGKAEDMRALKVRT